MRWWLELLLWFIVLSGCSKITTVQCPVNSVISYEQGAYGTTGTSCFKKD